jgi:hypothetical protein
MSTKENNFIKLLKPTGYAMRRQFNIQQIYALPTLCLLVLYLSENEQQILTPYTIDRLVFTTEMKCLLRGMD